jgi:hypothetical protein
MSKLPISLDRLKELARKLKRERLVTHTEALEVVAQAHGFLSWHSATLALADIPLRPVAAPSAVVAHAQVHVENPPALRVEPVEDPAQRLARRIAARNAGAECTVELEFLSIPASRSRLEFHRVRIGASVWSISLPRPGTGSNFFIHVKPWRRDEFWPGGTNWGDCVSLAYLTPQRHSPRALASPSWHLAKYENQHAADLRALSEEEVVEAGHQFGLSTDTEGRRPGRRSSIFASPAFASFAAAARAACANGRPLVSGETRGEPGRAVSAYLGEWHLRALSD